MSVKVLELNRINKNIFREYDIRGRVGETLLVTDAELIGKAFGTILGNSGKKKIAVGMDGRTSSPDLTQKLTSGLVYSGTSVCNIGIVPTPLLYFAVHYYGFDGGVMVTGSHNPKHDNGFKMMLGTDSFYGNDIKRLIEIINSNDYTSVDEGLTDNKDVRSDYICSALRGQTFCRELKVVWDCSNGAAGAVLRELVAKIPGRHIILNETVDGNFPAHDPDPTVRENLSQLRNEVLDNSCDLGIAFDGDADRIVVVDDRGHTIYGDQLLCILARDVLTQCHGAKIIADIKASSLVFEEVKRLGGEVIISRTGHSNIKRKMKETGALLAGEMSGHVFFADKWYGFDDALYAAIRLISFLSLQVESLGELLGRLPKTFSTREIRLVCQESAKFRIVDSIAKKIQIEDKGSIIDRTDGIRVTTEYGWWLVRASNTENALIVRIEAKNLDCLQKMKHCVRKLLCEHGVIYDDED